MKNWDTFEWDLNGDASTAGQKWPRHWKRFPPKTLHEIQKMWQVATGLSQGWGPEHQMHRWRRGIHFFTFYGLKEAGQGDAFYDLPWTTVASWGKAVVELAQEALEQHPTLGVSQPSKSIPGKLNHVEGSATFGKARSLKLHLSAGRWKGNGCGLEATPGNGQQGNPTITTKDLRS